MSPGESRSSLKGREAQRRPLFSPLALSPYPRAEQAGRFSEEGSGPAQCLVPTPGHPRLLLGAGIQIPEWAWPRLRTAGLLNTSAGPGTEPLTIEW